MHNRLKTRCRTGAALLYAVVLAIAPGLCGTSTSSAQQESIWLEAERFEGIEGYCWPMAKGVGERFEGMRTTDGHWGVSGPGWACEWTQGGESGFLSIACGAEDDAAMATKTIEVPVPGTYHVWVRYRDNREETERFKLTIAQPDREPWSAVYGEDPVVEEDNVMKLYWEGAFGWDRRTVELQRGPATLTIASTFKEPGCRQLDCLALTTDPSYRPRVKERPENHALKMLEDYREGIPQDVPSITRRTGDFTPDKSWRPKLFADSFWYLWNTLSPKTHNDWLRGGTNDIKFPHGLRASQPEYAALKVMYAGRDDLPIFSDPRIAPVFPGAGVNIFGERQTSEEKAKQERDIRNLFTTWLDRHPGTPFANLMNYAPNKPLDPEGLDIFFEKYAARYVGGISGENLGYFPVQQVRSDKEAAAGLAGITDRRAYADALGEFYMRQNEAKYRAIYGEHFDRLGSPYRHTIPCLSVAGPATYHLSFLWGAETVGTEMAIHTDGNEPMRMAFLRGAARQHEGRMMTYRSCNFGDSSTMFADMMSYTKPRNIMDNFYSVYSGAGMTWYKFDIWYQYMAGSSMFYHEQGFDEFWLPGGLSAAGQWPLRLSPKGKLVDRFLRLTAEEKRFERGVPFTPVGVLVDYAHGWDPADYAPSRWGHWGVEGHTATRKDIHDDAMGALFTILYHPIGLERERPITSTSENFPHGIFGDMFDVINAYPDTGLWTTIDTYPLVIVGGDIRLTEAEGRRLHAYMRKGGTLVVADGQLKGPGADQVGLPECGETSEADFFAWEGNEQAQQSQRFRYRPIVGGAPLAHAEDDDVVCAAFGIGKGRLLYVSAHYGMGIDRQPTPLMAKTILHATRGLMPIEVHGDVAWSLNKNDTGWMLTVLNAKGQIKPQHGIFPTDYTENRRIRVVAHVSIRSVQDRLEPSLALTIDQNVFTVDVPAGGIRVLDIKDRSR